MPAGMTTHPYCSCSGRRSTNLRTDAIRPYNGIDKKYRWTCPYGSYPASPFPKEWINGEEVDEAEAAGGWVWLIMKPGQT